MGTPHAFTVKENSIYDMIRKNMEPDLQEPFTMLPHHVVSSICLRANGIDVKWYVIGRGCASRSTGQSSIISTWMLKTCSDIDCAKALSVFRTLAAKRISEIFESDHYPARRNGLICSHPYKGSVAFQQHTPEAVIYYRGAMIKKQYISIMGNKSRGYTY